MVRPMALGNTRNTATADNTPEVEQDGARDTEHPPGPPSEKVADRDEAASTEVPARTGSAGGVVAGGVAIVSSGLGLCSLTGTALSDMLRSREEIVGQIEASIGGGGGDQIEAFYGGPWHAAALVNGIFALVAVVLGGVVFAVHARRSDTQAWVKAVAVAGAALGAVGVLVAGGMYFDLFAAQPELPQAPTLGGG
jgi:hypothetical protein